MLGVLDGNRSPALTGDAQISMTAYTIWHYSDLLLVRKGRFGMSQNISRHGVLYVLHRNGEYIRELHVGAWFIASISRLQCKATHTTSTT